MHKNQKGNLKLGRLRGWRLEVNDHIDWESQQRLLNSGPKVKKKNTFLKMNEIEYWTSKNENKEQGTKEQNFKMIVMQKTYK